jgi:hypothetical protein
LADCQSKARRASINPLPHDYICSASQSPLQALRECRSKGWICRPRDELAETEQCDAHVHTRGLHSGAPRQADGEAEAVMGQAPQHKSLKRTQQPQCPPGHASATLLSAQQGGGDGLGISPASAFSDPSKTANPGDATLSSGALRAAPRSPRVVFQRNWMPLKNDFPAQENVQEK